MSFLSMVRCDYLPIWKEVVGLLAVPGHVRVSAPRSFSNHLPMQPAVRPGAAVPKD